MPQNKSAVARYRAIDKRIRRKYRPYPTIEDLIEAVEEVTGVNISKSSVQKDIMAMKSDPDLGYHAPIEFSRAHKGYFYTDPAYSIEGIPLNEDEITAIELALRSLNQFRGTDFMKDFEGAIDKIFAKISVRRTEGLEEHIQLEQAPEAKGNDLIPHLSEFIRNREPLKFIYTKFQDEVPVEHVLHPYLLKEYRNRWYLIGLDEAKNEIRTFGLDRIDQIAPAEGVRFRKDSSFNAEHYFKHALGITILNNEPPQDILLSFSPVLGKYVKAQPLHVSQQVVEDKDDKVVINLRLMKSQELVSLILGYGNQVRVLSPEWLKQEINQRLPEKY